jgi:hypothetical protein
MKKAHQVPKPEEEKITWHHIEKKNLTPAKEKKHEPTAVKREMTQKIVQSGQVGPNLEEAAEIARKKGMAKGTAGAAEAGSEYEQGTVLRRFYLETMKSFSCSHLCK